MEYGIEECRRALRELAPKIGNYAWFWALLRARARRHGGEFPLRYHALLRRLIRPDKPYFIGSAAGGTAFLGDARDVYSAISQVCPNHDTALIGFVRARLAARGGAFADIGANVGIVAAAVARSTHGPVFAFEPAPETARRCAATFALNGLDNAILFACAASDRDGEIPFHAAPANSDWAAVDPAGPATIHWSKVTVCCCRLDTLADEGKIGGVGLLKIDVEGHEPQVLAGAERLIGNDRPDIIFEYNREIASRVGWTAEEAAGLIRRAGDYPRVGVLLDDTRLGSFPPAPDGPAYVNIFCEAAVVAGSTCLPGATHAAAG